MLQAFGTESSVPKDHSEPKENPGLLLDAEQSMYQATSINLDMRDPASMLQNCRGPGSRDPVKGVNFSQICQPKTPMAETRLPQTRPADLSVI